LANQSILFSQMEPPAQLEREFNDWYDNEHVPVRLKLSGFTQAVRYIVHPDDPQPLQTPRYAVTYFMRDLQVLETPEYRQLKDAPSERTDRMLKSVSKFTRFIAKEVSRSSRREAEELTTTPVLYVVLFAVPEDWQEEFEAWYDEEHISILMKEKMWRACVRYRIFDGIPSNWTHLTLHYLEDSSALRSPFREEARQTVWRQRLSKEPWFQGSYNLYRRLEPPVLWQTILEKP
jgi:hypothetical protein